MTHFPAIDKWIVPQSAVTDSLREMASDGLRGNEGVTLWLGKRMNGQAEVTHLVALRGPGIVKKPLLLVIRPGLLNKVTDLTIRYGVALIGQIHSHYGQNTDLSITDKTYGVAVPYYLSIVAPYFALRTDITISDCGIHVFEPSKGYRRMNQNEVLSRVQVVQKETIPFLTVKGDGDGE